MARSYRIKIGSIYLTIDGLVTGRPCKVAIENVDALLTPDKGNVSVGSDGSPFREIPLTPTGAGRDFAFVFASMKSAVYNSLKSALDTAAGSGADFNVTGTGTPGDFDVDAIVFDNPEYISNGGFSGDWVQNVRVSLITTAIN